MSRSVVDKSNPRIKQRVSSAPARQTQPVTKVDDAIPADPKTVTSAPTSATDSEDRLNGDITQRYFDASLEYLGFRQESSPGMYWHNADHTIWFNVLVFTTRRQLLAELVLARTKWIVQAGEKPERKYPYLLRSKHSLEYSNKYHWFLHWLQPWENGSRLRRRQMMTSVTECPTKAHAMKLLHQLNETKPGWEKDPHFHASIVSDLRA